MFNGTKGHNYDKKVLRVSGISLPFIIPSTFSTPSLKKKKNLTCAEIAAGLFIVQ